MLQAIFKAAMFCDIVSNSLKEYNYQKKRKLSSKEMKLPWNKSYSKPKPSVGREMAKARMRRKG